MQYEYNGALQILRILKKLRDGKNIELDDVDLCVEKNDFFCEFYSELTGLPKREIINAVSTALDFGINSNKNNVYNKLHQGFYESIAMLEKLESSISALSKIPSEKIEKNVLLHLPPKTELDYEVYFTIDAFNGGFQYKNGIGYSILKNDCDPIEFSEIISHELHHRGFGYWSEKDLRRQKILREKTGRSVAVGIVEHLLSEGLAIFFFNNDMMIESTDRFQKQNTEYKKRIYDLKKSEKKLFSKVSKLMSKALEKEPDIQECQNEFNDIRFDVNGILPIAHYVGYRMIETIMTTKKEKELIECIKSIDLFLRLYNDAASTVGAFLFDSDIVIL